MASLIQDKNGTYRVQVLTADGQRVTIRLGRIGRRGQAESAKDHIEHLHAANRYGQAVPEATMRWVAGLTDKVHGRLAKARLVDPRQGPVTLGTLLDRYFADLSVKKATAVIYGHTRRCLIAHFGASRGLATITEADADDFRRYLREEARLVMVVQRKDGRNPATVFWKKVGLARATVGKRVGVARQMFKQGVRWKMLAQNPFADVKGGQQVNKAREQFITREETQAIIDACPGAQWRLIVALARYGGLRCPSEVLRLTWAEVLWSRNRIWVPSPKTEHHAGRDHRMIPLYPELRPYLLEVFEAAEPGTERVITEYPVTTPNLRTQLHRIMRRAGMVPGPKMWQNMRSSRETELAERWPIHLVCAWMGNTKAVAQEHYLQIRDTDFDRAAAQEGPSQSDAKSGAVVSAFERNRPQPPQAEEAATRVFTPLQQVSVSPCETTSYDSGRGWIRTNEGVSQRVYSPSPLATRAHAPGGLHFTVK